MTPKPEDLTSGSFSSPPRDAKHHLMKRDGLSMPWGSCTICQDEGLQYYIAHILPRHDRERFIGYQNAGLLPADVTSLGHLDVLIYLCSNCHGLWDSDDPRLVIIPKNIEFFIQWEEADYRRREAEANVGNPPPQRTVPRRDDYDGGYAWYYLSDRRLPSYLQMLAQANRCNVDTKASPTALILKAGKAIGFPLRQPDGHGISHDVRAQLCQLFNLWERPPPMSEHASILTTETQTGPSDLKKDRSPTDDDEPGGSKIGRRGEENPSEGKRRRTGSQNASQQDEAEDDSLRGVESWEKEQDFLFGPHMTAAKIMERLG
ncbi:hypothetical protein TWF696_005940 [Orbilia brochopaga]|uniref:HNH endonuclease n=1 Tax=Orbilia brochopaga TaxID=3140254 RepID=A0AAV9UXJ0_9PEZI